MKRKAKHSGLPGAQQGGQQEDSKENGEHGGRGK